MKIALIDIETLSPQYKLKLTDVITGIGIKNDEEDWIRVIKPSGDKKTDIDEADLIYETIQHLKEIKPDILTGCYLWGFDLPHLLCRVDELDYFYKNATGRQLKLEFECVLNGLRIIDLAKTDYILEKIAPRYGKSFLKVDEICKELDIKTEEFPEDFHVWASAKAIAGDQEHLVKRLKNDLKVEWAILQTLLSKKLLEL